MKQSFYLSCILHQIVSSQRLYAWGTSVVYLVANIGASQTDIFNLIVAQSRKLCRRRRWSHRFDGRSKCTKKKNNKKQIYWMLVWNSILAFFVHLFKQSNLMLMWLYCLVLLMLQTWSSPPGAGGGALSYCRRLTLSAVRVIWRLFGSVSRKYKWCTLLNWIEKNKKPNK